ncbi:hypothetical protein JV173_02370 [Acholeplasma equirhinis]|uniref:alpha-amylase family glycosyl hydrolase n=1 Tax=Acholeplasma equirhinis TaxID=555393 RepID=UPI00197A7C73|nr:alpha-amylase family glycosyl hydrolase [Acholeplasma equirhinis]MBN3490352.1 hypothetical protein [Acholeplasma equirhinis]
MKKLINLMIIALLSVLLIACDTTSGGGNEPIDQTPDLRALNPRNDIYYQVFIRSFADSDGDGVGDINGLTANLDYIKDLGATAIWMLPFNETDTDWNSYHGYRIKDYYKVNPEYGTMEDLENLIEEANKLDIKIVMDLVINHTSDTHPWFMSAKEGVNSPYRDWYIWTAANTAFESFAGGMKDLNLNNPDVVQEIKDIMAFWVDKGIHGFRFDAAKHLFLGDPGSQPAQAQAKNYTFLKNLKDYVKTINPDVFFVGEVFEYEYVAYNQYYIGLDSLFDFYAAAQIWGKIGGGNQIYQLVSNIEKSFNTYKPYDTNYVPSIFISNHDIDRIASRNEFNGANGLNKLKMAAQFMLTLPGSPHIYYGDEIGMKGVAYGGENPNGQGAIWDQYRRAPFLWGASNQYQTDWLMPYNGSNQGATVASSINDSNSLYTTYKTFANIRKDTPALMYGNYMKAWKDNSSFLQGFVRQYSTTGFSQTVLVIHNISDTARSVDVEYLDYIYGNSLTIPAWGTLVLEIDGSKVNNYI